jgi:uncharacterized protein (DUF1501 family)
VGGQLAAVSEDFTTLANETAPQRAEEALGAQAATAADFTSAVSELNAAQARIQADVDTADAIAAREVQQQVKQLRQVTDLIRAAEQQIDIIAV